MSRQLTAAQLKELFLFESLDTGQLDWLAARGRAVTYQAGDPVYAEGQPATCFVVLLSGTISLSRHVRGDDIEVNRTDQVGSYGGAVQSFIRDPNTQLYVNTMYAITDVEVFELPADEFGPRFREWFPMAVHLLEGLFLGLRNNQTLVNERERLLALGAL